MKKRSLKYALSMMSIGLLTITGLVVWNLRTRSITGPTSEIGLVARIKVSDMQIGIGADYYADVSVSDADGNILVTWDDPGGQESWEGVQNMTTSMQWLDDSTLTFTTLSSSEVILETKHMANNPRQ